MTTSSYSSIFKRFLKKTYEQTTNMDPSSSEVSSDTLYRQNTSLSTTVDHLRLVKQDPSSIRNFIRAYDAYVNEVRSRAKQLVLQGAPATTEISRPVNLKYCVDGEYLEAAIILNRIDGVTSFEALSEEKLKTYLDNKAEESTDIVTLGTIDAIVQSNLKMNLQDKSAKSRMETLFISYVMPLRKHEFLWVKERNQKVAVNHVLYAVTPFSLQND